MARDHPPLLALLPSERWHVIGSSLGVHVVQITDYTEAGTARLEEVAAAVQKDWLLQQRNRAVQRAHGLAPPIQPGALMRILVALLLVIAWPAQAHRMGLARLLIEQGETVELSLAMNPPAAKHRLRPLPPSGCVALSGWRPTLDRLHLAAQWRCSKPIEQLTIDQQGDYEGSLLVQLDRDGARIERVSRGGAPLDFRLPSQGQPANAFWGGFNHLLAGWDHLLLIALIGVSGRSLRSLLSATLAFTLGHAVSLTVVALGWVRLPGALSRRRSR